MCPELHGSRVLPHRPASVGAARELVRVVLHGAVRPETVDAAESVTSELVTNAIVHAGTMVEVDVRLERDGSVYLEVTDGAPWHPLRPRAGTERSTGRGLALVDALTREWGLRLHPHTKVLWCRLADAPTTPHPPSDESVYRRLRPEPGLEVALENTPLRLYQSWLEEAEALLRDYLLAGMTRTPIEDSLRRHVQCSQALALLVEAFADASGSEHQVRHTPRGGHAKVAVTVPPGAVEDFATLNDVLETAILTASNGEYLSAVTSPAAQRFRRWVCREVLTQSRGGAPTPWQEGPR